MGMLTGPASRSAGVGLVAAVCAIAIGTSTTAAFAVAAQPVAQVISVVDEPTVKPVPALRLDDPSAKQRLLNRIKQALKHAKKKHKGRKSIGKKRVHGKTAAGR